MNGNEDDQQNEVDELRPYIENVLDHLFVEYDGDWDAFQDEAIGRFYLAGYPASEAIAIVTKYVDKTVSIMGAEEETEIEDIIQAVKENIIDYDLEASTALDDMPGVVDDDFNKDSNEAEKALEETKQFYWFWEKEFWLKQGEDWANLWNDVISYIDLQVDDVWEDILYAASFWGLKFGALLSTFISDFVSTFSNTFFEEE